MAGVALAGVRLGHERDAVPVLGRDLLRAGLVDRVVVAGGHRVGVAERDLVLAEVALALGRLHVQAGPGHLVPDPAQQRLDPGGAQDRVVHVVLVGRDQIAVVLGRGLLVGVLVDDELELGPGQRHPAAFGQPRRLGREYLPRRGQHRRAVVPGQVRDHQGRARVPRQQAHGARVRHHDEVAVAAVPGRHGVPVDRVHVHVHGEQVVAALGVVFGHLVQVELRRQALALQPALHVGEGEHDGVDLALADRDAQLLQGQQAAPVRRPGRPASGGKLPLDRGQFLRRALDLGPGEPLPAPRPASRCRRYPITTATATTRS